MDPKSAQYVVGNIKLLMKKTGLDSQPKLAEASGVSQTNLSNILRGANIPGISTIERIARAFGVEPWQMLTPNVIEACADQYMRQNRTPAQNSSAG